MKQKAKNHNTQKFVKAIYLISLADILNRRLVMQKLDSLLIKNCIALCCDKYNPPS